MGRHPPVSRRLIRGTQADSPACPFSLGPPDRLSDDRRMTRLLWMREITPDPLTADAFAPFGDVIEASERAEQMAINYGQTIRFNDLARIEVEGGRAIVSIFRGKPLDPPLLR